jgi:hypothetical protein
MQRQAELRDGSVVGTVDIDENVGSLLYALYSSDDESECSLGRSEGADDDRVNGGAAEAEPEVPQEGPEDRGLLFADSGSDSNNDSEDGKIRRGAWTTGGEEEDGDDNLDDSSVFTIGVGGGSPGAGGGTWASRQIELERRLAENRVELHRGRTSQLSSCATTGDLAAPHCACGDKAILRCSSCAPGSSFLCAECDAEAHGSHLIHSREAFDESSNGFRAIPVSPRVWSINHCPSCFESFSAEQRCPETLPSFSVTLHTHGSGYVKVTVNPLKCPSCSSACGSTPAEHNCTPSASGTDWYQNTLLQSFKDMDRSSGYSLSNSSVFESYKKSCERNKCFGLSSESARKLSEARRLFEAVDDDAHRQKDLGDVLEDIRLDISIQDYTTLKRIKDCAACGKNPHSWDGDGCAKLRVRRDAGQSFADPLLRSTFGDLRADGEGAIVDVLMESFRVWRKNSIDKVNAQSRGVPAPDPILCTDFRALLKTTSKDYTVSRVYSAVCSHNIAADGFSRLVTTAGEGLEYAHSLLRETLHLSGKLPLVVVFGPVPEVRRPCPSIFYCDIACKLHAFLKKFDPEVLLHVKILLGMLHGK